MSQDGSSRLTEMNPFDANFQDCMHRLNCMHWEDSPMYYQIPIPKTMCF